MERTLGLKTLVLAGLLAALCLAPEARADQPLTELSTWTGAIDFFSTGAPLAIDGNDPDSTMVDTMAQPATVSVNASEVPAGASLVAAYLYWGGSIVNDDCGGTTIDDTVDFTPPGGSISTVVADQCFCSDADAGSYDVQMCRKDVAPLLVGMIGDYTVDGFDALIENGATNNASFSVVLIFRADSLPPRRIGLWDGLQTMHSAVNPSAVVTLGNLEVDNPAEGDLTWYVLEGDFGGSVGEQVSVTGQPGSSTLVLSDSLNPADNPMNHTINTTVPTQAWSIGVDIDRFDISAALTPGDTSVATTYEAGDDKYWIAYNIVGVNVHEAVFGAQSTKTWDYVDDVDPIGVPSAGDTLRYTIHLVNSGTAPGLVSLDDPIPAEAASWAMVDAGGGNDVSTATSLVVTDIPVDPAASVDVTFDVVLADAADETSMVNIASFDAGSDGDSGILVAPEVLIRRDGDGDTVFDNDDNCPDDPNPGQEDGDNNGIGDACDQGGQGGSGGQGTGGSGATGGSGPTGGGGSGGTTSSSGSPSAPATRADSGCGCHLAPDRSAGGLAALLALGAAAWRRRRRCAP